MDNNHLLTLSAALVTNTPLLLWGPPGVGKTATIQAVARHLDLPLEVVIASIREPSDFAGLPIVTGEAKTRGVTLAPPAWAVRLAEAGRGILFLDEITTAPPAVQAALLRVVLDRVAGDLDLPAGVTIVAAANPPEQAAGGWELTPPLANRFAHLDWPQPWATHWSEALITGWPAPNLPTIPDDWQAKLPLARGLVSGFIQSRPSLLHALPSDPAQQGRAWPSPRTWEMATKMLAAGLSVTEDEGALTSLVASCVGQAVALEFMALVGGDMLPNPEEMLKHPETVELPTRPDKLMMALQAVVAAVIDNVTPERWDAAWTIMARAAKEQAVDVAASAARSLSTLWAEHYNRPGMPALEMPEDKIEPFVAVLRAALKY